MLMAVGLSHLEPTAGGFLQNLSAAGRRAGMAEVVKGAGLKIRSRMGSWVRIHSLHHLI